MKKTLIAAVICLAIILAGCSSKPKGDPADVLNNYYTLVKDGNFEKAYDLLSIETQKRVSENDFKLFQELNREISTLTSYKVEKVKEEKDKELDGISYDHFAEFTVVEEVRDLIEAKDTADNRTRFVVSEGKEWKVYREENFNEVIATQYAIVSSMYLFGKGKSANYIEAISAAKRGLEYDSKSEACQYYLATAYLKANRVDEAMTTAKTLIDQSEDPYVLSDIYVVLALAEEANEDYVSAKKHLETAIEKNKDNEYARTNLARYNN